MAENDVEEREILEGVGFTRMQVEAIAVLRDNPDAPETLRALEDAGFDFKQRRGLVRFVNVWTRRDRDFLGYSAAPPRPGADQSSVRA